MNEQIFRQKSIDKVSSPESLNDYVKVATPSVWMVLVGIIVLLIGVCVWGVVGRLDTKVYIGVTSSSNEQTCYVSEHDIDKISVGQTFSIDGTECTITEIVKSPIQGKTLSPLMLHALGINGEEWVYSAKLAGSLPSGEYESFIIVESVSPMSFVFN